MHITNVALAVRDLPTAADFYEGTLGLPVDRTPHVARVRVGTSTLSLTQNPAHEGAHHVAITVPSNKFPEAKAWVRERADLLDADGADEFECSPTWNAHSVYFEGGDGTVLEFIVRRELDNETTGPFTSSDLLSVSEVGVAVPDLPATIDALSKRFDIVPYGWNSADFAPVGDVHGLLILVNPGRAWFPTTNLVAEITPIDVTAKSAVTAQLILNSASQLRLEN